MKKCFSFEIAKVILFFNMAKKMYFCTLFPAMSKVRNIEYINIINEKTLVTVGMFDGVHIGHQQLLRHFVENAARSGMRPIAVTFDRHPRLVVDPGYRPQMLSTTSERLAMLEECGIEEVAVVHFDKETASMSACKFATDYLLGHLNMGGLFLGYDNQFGRRNDNDFDKLPALGRQMGFGIFWDDAVLIDGVEVSSTKIRHSLMRGDVERAASMLGYPYTVEGTVVHGRHVGRGMGFPTANVSISSRDKMLPMPGVYMLRVEWQGSVYKAMANLGPQPTFHLDKPVLEVHILDFDGDLYGATLRLSFLHRLRDIVAFATQEALMKQLENDRKEVKRLSTFGL